MSKKKPATIIHLILFITAALYLIFFGYNTHRNLLPETDIETGMFINAVNEVATYCVVYISACVLLVSVFMTIFKHREYIALIFHAAAGMGLGIGFYENTRAIYENFTMQGFINRYFYIASLYLAVCAVIFLVKFTAGKAAKKLEQE